MSKPIHLHIALPGYGLQCMLTSTNYLINFVKLCEKLGIKTTIDAMGNSSFIPMARNMFVANFRANVDATHLFFLDADVASEDLDDLLAMVAFDVPLVCAPYPVKRIDYARIRDAVKKGVDDTSILEQIGSSVAVNPVPGATEDEFHVVRNRRFVRVQDGATGFMLIRRDCVEQMCSAYFNTCWYRSDPKDKARQRIEVALFDSSFEDAPGFGRRYLTEDYTFCRRWQKIGGDVWCLLDAKLTHTGTKIYRGSALLEHWGSDTSEASPAE
jgi:hypothetical protein